MSHIYYLALDFLPKKLQNNAEELYKYLSERRWNTNMLEKYKMKPQNLFSSPIIFEIIKNHWSENVEDKWQLIMNVRYEVLNKYGSWKRMLKKSYDKHKKNLEKCFEKSVEESKYDIDLTKMLSDSKYKSYTTKKFILKEYSFPELMFKSLFIISFSL